VQIPIKNEYSRRFAPVFFNIEFKVLNLAAKINSTYLTGDFLLDKGGEK